MPAIRYVCLSDTHFGADNSLLTYLDKDRRKADPMAQSPVLETLVACLRTILKPDEPKPTLVLNGDIMELALATDSQAAMAFERFLELVFPVTGPRMFQDRVLYLPGNHDHHLWETAREAQYLSYVTKEKKPGQKLDEPWHATNMFPERRKFDHRQCQSQFLHALAERCRVPEIFFETVYPNLGLYDQDSGRTVVFTHGHFFESIYTVVSQSMTMLFPRRREPRQVWDFETENFAWIDFFWSTLGRSGAAGEDVERIYDKMQSPKAFSEIQKNLANGLINRFAPGPLSFARSWALNKVLNAIFDLLSKPESKQKGMDALSEDAWKTLASYVKGPLFDQIKGELSTAPISDVTLIFGHTHKPFEQLKKLDPFAEDVKVYNTGGWVVDTVKVTAQAGWAVVFVDESFNVATLRGAGDDPARGVRVAQAATSENPLSQRLKASVAASSNEWSAFAKALENSIAIHLENLKQKIASATNAAG